MSRKRKLFNDLPKLNTMAQVRMWNEIFFYGGKELLYQRQRRTAHSIQNIMGRDNVKIQETEDGLEFIFFSKELQKRVGGKPFDKMHQFI